MKSKLLLCLALVLSAGLCGCSTPRQPAVIAPERESGLTELPVRFAGYRQLYEFIAKREGVQSFSDSVFKLAADSETKIHAFDEMPNCVWVITPHFYNGGIYDEIRGAQGNGGIYLVRPLTRDFTSGDTDHGFELIGIASGNSYGFSSVNHVPRLTTYWHLSAAESPETDYEWNGTFFKQLTSDKSNQ